MISFWCSVSTRFFFGEGAILTYSYRQEILTSNYYVITFQRRDGYRVNHNHTRYVHTDHEHSGHVSLKWSAFPYRYRPTWSSSSNLDSGNFLLTCVLAGEFLGRPTFGERLIWMKKCMKKLQKTKDKLEAVTPNTVFILILSLPLSRLLVLTLWKYWHWGISTTKNVERLLCGDVFSLGIYWNNG